MAKNKVTEVKKKTEAQIISEVVSRMTDAEWQAFAKAGKTDADTAKKQQIQLAKLEENKRYQTWKRKLDELTRRRMTELVVAGICEDVPPDELEREMRRSYPQLFI